jgi:3',5'-cyclic AMP phosphodiesterase CpdA
VFGTAEPELRSDALVVCGLDSTWPARQQGGRLSESQLERVARVLADAPPDALRIVALHHHLAGAPWRASRKLPLKHRDQVLAAFGAAGDEPPRASLVLATAPGLGRPRPRRTGEAHGLHVYRWSESELVVETHVWDGAGFAYSATRRFPRSV